MFRVFSKSLHILRITFRAPAGIHRGRAARLHRRRRVWLTYGGRMPSAEGDRRAPVFWPRQPAPSGIGADRPGCLISSGSRSAVFGRTWHCLSSAAFSEPRPATCPTGVVRPSRRVLPGRQRLLRRTIQSTPSRRPGEDRPAYLCSRFYMLPYCPVSKPSRGFPTGPDDGRDPLAAEVRGP